MNPADIALWTLTISFVVLTLIIVFNPDQE